jgi:inosine-uridine nucleoside N-ribohydrolase
VQDPTVPDRPLARIPEPGERVPLLIDTDAGCECDDQYAIALAIHAPERFDIQGFVATHFGDRPESIAEAKAEIERVLEHSEMAGRWPVAEGGWPMTFSSVPSESEGVDLIIDRAMRHTPERPMWIAILGPTTNTASALVQAPEIADRVVVLFHGRTQFWPRLAWNNNVDKDLKATRILFACGAPFVLFDAGTHLHVSVADTERELAPRGRIGAYLHELRMANPFRRTMQKAFFDLGDTAWLLDPTLGRYDQTDAPELTMECTYDWTRTRGRMLRVYEIDNARTWRLLFDTLAEAYPDAG